MKEIVETRKITPKGILKTPYDKYLVFEIVTSYTDIPVITVMGSPEIPCAVFTKDSLDKKMIVYPYARKITTSGTFTLEHRACKPVLVEVLDICEEMRLEETAHED
jgi:hypothetical protein